MMKLSIKSCIASALLISGVGHAAEIYNKDGNKLDLYGKVQGENYISNNDSLDGDQSYMRFGFKGQTQINDLITGYGQWEQQIQLNNSEGGSDAQKGNKSRLGFAGLKVGQYGSFDYGRNYGLVYDAIAYTDVLPEFGGATGSADGFLRGRSTGVATYRNRDFFGLVDGLSFGLQYQGKNERDAISTSNGDGWATSLGYALDSGISVVGGYANLDRTNAQNADGVYGHGAHGESWAVGAKYDNNQWYFGTFYGQTRNAYAISNSLTGESGFANKTESFEATLQYQFINGFRPSIAWVQTKAKDIEGVGDAYLLKFLEPGLTWYFNKNMKTFVAWKINLLEDNNKLGLPNDDQLALGVVYQF
ncbi:porin [Pantoea sp. At-9b]|uniref:porin n=1 Tax=Pantoea sp. (strain At-9b) TaxID=592316 RepID=UPI0001B3FB98|nr:porin [Pantoea sp. At-9b]